MLRLKNTKKGYQRKASECKYLECSVHIGAIERVLRPALHHELPQLDGHHRACVWPPTVTVHGYGDLRWAQAGPGFDTRGDFEDDHREGVDVAG